MSTCAKKVIYYTDKEAKKAAKKMYKKYGKKQWFYQCDDCEYYHLSRTEPNRYKIQQIARKVR